MNWKFIWYFFIVGLFLVYNFNFGSIFLWLILLIGMGEFFGLGCGIGNCYIIILFCSFI